MYDKIKDNYFSLKQQIVVNNINSDLRKLLQTAYVINNLRETWRA